MHFDWLKSRNKLFSFWDNTVLGTIILRKGKLILETNSEKRGTQGKKLLKQYLGHAIEFEKMTIQCPYELMETVEGTRSDSINDQGVTQLPVEAKEQLKVYGEKYWDDWLDTPIKVLNNKTPRQASKTSEGRERLEGLFLLYDKKNMNDEMGAFAPDIERLCRELGLPTNE